MTALHPVGRTTLRTVLLLAGALAIVCVPVSLSAQYSEPLTSSASQGLGTQAFDPDDIPAHIAVLDGIATIEREGRVEDAIENDAILAGDRLRTERGRVEILFADGSALDLDQYSSIDLLSESLVRLLGGR